MMARKLTAINPGDPQPMECPFCGGFHGYTFKFKTQERPTSKWLIFKRETSAAERYTTAMYSVTNKDQGAVLGIIKWYGPFRQYSFLPSSGCIFERTCLRDIANFCEWLTTEHKAGNKKPD